MLDDTQKQDYHGLDAWREQIEEALNLGGKGQSLYRRSHEAYADFLEYVFCHYGENAREAERSTAEG